MMKALSSPRGTMFASFSSPKRVTFAATTSSNMAQLVAGMDISSWETVEIADVQPGPLGIFLADQCPEAAVLDHFGPTPDGVKGAVELDGRVPVGSVLVAVNEFDLLEQKLSLQEVARVLRETSHVVRSLHFKVPPTRSLDAIEVSAVGSAASPTSSAVGELEERVLIKGMDNSSFKEKKSSAGGDKRSWNFMSLLSPTQIASGVAAMSGFGASPSSSTPVAPEFPVAEEPASTPTSPSATTTVREASHTLSSRSLYDSNKLAAKIPPGPIGLNLDGSISDRAVVLGFLPLPDGSAGVLERRGDIPPGSVLVAINGSSVTHLGLEDIRTRLGALASFDRELVFELPTPDDGAPRVLTAKDRAAAFNRLSDLDKRRKIELGLVLKHDSSRIKRHECWFLIDAQWMARWVEFTSKGGVNPGPITNHVLLEHDWEARVSGLAAGRPDAPRAGLELTKDYRCVTPMVWALFAELHGTNNVPVQARYVLDAYAEPLAATDVTPILTEPQLKAATLVNELRERYPGAFAD